MKRILGIDYGTKKLGFALSDEEQTIAFPKAVVPNHWKEIQRAIGEFGVADIGEAVVGLPVGLDGQETPLSRDARAFAARIRDTFGFEIHFENEAYTSAAVKTASGETNPDQLDASAAAMILQSFLDRRRGGNVVK